MDQCDQIATELKADTKIEKYESTGLINNNGNEKESDQNSSNAKIKLEIKEELKSIKDKSLEEDGFNRKSDDNCKIEIKEEKYSKYETIEVEADDKILENIDWIGNYNSELMPDIHGQCDIKEGQFQEQDDTLFSTGTRSGDEINYYKCESCDKRFKIKSILICHMMKFHREKPYQCKICGKGFNRNGYLIRHIKIHIKKPYQCKICDKKFTENENFMKHIKIHSGKKLYQCKICNKRYTQIGSLNNHLKIHTREKP